MLDPVIDNERIARAFDELADLLEISGESPFKLRAYRSFADTARGLTEPLAEIAERGGLLEMEGVGKAIAGKVEELLAKGTCDALERARAEVPVSLLEVLRVPGLGAKSVKKLWQEAGVTTLAELRYACEENRLASLSGFGAKKQDKTLAAVRALLEGQGRMLLAGALEAHVRIAHALGEVGLRDVALVGDARRGVEVVSDVEIVVKGGDAARVETALRERASALEMRAVARDGGAVIATFETGESARVAPTEESAWIETLVTRTGDAAHVAWLEDLAKKKGGLAKVCAGAKREEDVYAALGVPFAPPELREGATPDVPEVVAGVQGIFHVHTDWSDGGATIAEMARAAKARGYTYLGISDHSRAASYANGLDEARLAQQAKAIADARREVPDVGIFHGIEVDVLTSGDLDLSDDALFALDFVIASVHSRFAMSHEEMTARIVRAVSHPLVTILGHPTGRLLLGRAGYTFDLDAVARAAAANDTYLEINANPQRLDLSDAMVKRAAELGARFAIDPDAHSPRGVADTPLGVTVARRARLGAAQVLNAQTREQIEKTLKARKERAKKRAS